MRARMGAEPIRWFVEYLNPLMDEARAALASFVRCRAEDLIFIPNATQAVATVLANLEPLLNPGDELLAPGHEYPACMNNLRRAAQRTARRSSRCRCPSRFAPRTRSWKRSWPR